MNSSTNFLLHGSISEGNSHVSPVRAPWDVMLQNDQFRRSFPLLMSKLMLEMAQRSEECRDDSNEKVRQRSLVVSSSSATEISLKAPEELAAPAEKKKSSYIFVADGMEILNTSSSLTASEQGSISRSSTHHTESSSVGSSLTIDDDLEVQLDDVLRTNESSSTNPMKMVCVPYAQLCFDPEQNALVTLMEVDLATTSGQRSKRLCLVDSKARVEAKERLSDPNESRTDSTVSERSEDEMIVSGTAVEPGAALEYRFDEPIVFSSLSPEAWLEEADKLDLYLLQECQDPWEIADNKAQGGCAEALKKLLIASKSLRVFKSRSGQDYSTPVPLSGIGYTFLQEI